VDSLFSQDEEEMRLWSASGLGPSGLERASRTLWSGLYACIVKAQSSSCLKILDCRLREKWKVRIVSLPPGQLFDFDLFSLVPCIMTQCSNQIQLSQGVDVLC
jgi:hypothetical protein